MSSANNEVVIPALLQEMVKKVTQPFSNSGMNEKVYNYLVGFIEGTAIREYSFLVKREEGVYTGNIVPLICELAVCRALIRWYEVKDKPPPMPSIDLIDDPS